MITMCKKVANKTCQNMHKIVKPFFHNWKSRLCKFLSTIYLLTPTSLYMYEKTIYSSYHWNLISSPITMSKWEPRARYLSVADMRAPANDKRASPIAVPESLEDFQEVFLNFHFNGSALLFGRPAVNAIHFKNPPVPLQVSFVIMILKFHVYFY